MERDVDQRVQALAVLRIAVGGALLLTPGLCVRVLGGRHSGGPVARLLARTTGGRDLALGLGTLLAARHGSSVRGWLEASMVADATDAVGVMLARRDLPRGRAVLAALSAVSAVGFGRRLVAALPAPGATGDYPGPTAAPTT
ncbi:MAG: hypothetical protein ABR540_04890 [Acidimicrobiales bacterium]